MSDCNPLVCFLYLSRLADDRGFEIFRPIVDASRRNNPSLGITGALVFDGERFCQFLEGPRDKVEALAARIQADPRHGQFRVLHSGPDPHLRCFPIWASGYCGPEELDIFDAEDGPRGPDALPAVIAIVAAADMSTWA